MLKVCLRALTVCCSLSIQGTHLHSDTLKEVLLPVAVVWGPHHKVIREQVIQLHHPDPLLFCWGLCGVTQPHQLVFARYRGRLNPLGVAPGAELIGGLAVALAGLKQWHQVHMTHIALLLPAGCSGIYHNLPRGQCCAAHPLERVCTQDGCQLEEAAGVDECQPGGILELLPHSQQVGIGCGLCYFCVAPAPDICLHLYTGVFGIQGAQVGLYYRIGLGHLGAQDAIKGGLLLLKKSRHVEVAQLPQLIPSAIPVEVMLLTDCLALGRGQHVALRMAGCGSEYDAPCCEISGRQYGSCPIVAHVCAMMTEYRASTDMLTP